MTMRRRSSRSASTPATSPKSSQGSRCSTVASATSSGSRIWEATSRGPAASGGRARSMTALTAYPFRAPSEPPPSPSQPLPRPRMPASRAAATSPRPTPANLSRRDRGVAVGARPGSRSIWCWDERRHPDSRPARRDPRARRRPHAAGPRRPRGARAGSRACRRHAFDQATWTRAPRPWPSCCAGRGAGGRDRPRGRRPAVIGHLDGPEGAPTVTALRPPRRAAARRRRRLAQPRRSSRPSATGGSTAAAPPTTRPA